MYEGDGVRFSGQRAILTVRPTHIHVTLLDAGELRYKGTGLKTSNSVVQMTLVPGGFADGEVVGSQEKQLTFYGLGRSPSSLSFRADDVQFLGEGDKNEASYAVAPGHHKISIEPD